MKRKSDKTNKKVTEKPNNQTMLVGFAVRTHTCKCTRHKNTLALSMQPYIAILHCTVYLSQQNNYKIKRTKKQKHTSNHIIIKRRPVCAYFKYNNTI